MDQQKRKKIIIAVIIIVVLAILFWVWRSMDVFRPIDNTNTNEAPKFVPPSASSEFDPNLPAALSSDELSAVNLAKSYAERFGSWSTDQLGVNLKELAPLSTKNMNKYLNSIELGEKQVNYNGITTKSISSVIDEWSADSATITVKTQRIETKTDLSQNVYYQDIKFDLIKANDKWLVDAAWWQDKK
jgi:hypothetical protein